MLTNRLTIIHNSIYLSKYGQLDKIKTKAILKPSITSDKEDLTIPKATGSIPAI
tara:strand:- start:258 stop:419 length:162 start_codon:yes stop_codon:yes gene_type:complete